MGLSDIEQHELDLLQMKRDMLVRRLCKETNHNERTKMNKVLDQVCDQLEELLECEQCGHRMKSCTCPF